MRSLKINDTLWKSLKVIENHCKSMKINEIIENQWKSMKINENHWKSTKTIENHCKSIKMNEIIENQWQSMKINENRYKTMKVLRWQEASLESSRVFYGDSKRQPNKSKPTSMQSLSLLSQGQQLHPQSALTSYHRSIEGCRGRRQRR